VTSPVLDEIFEKEAKLLEKYDELSGSHCFVNIPTLFADDNIEDYEDHDEDDTYIPPRIGIDYQVPVNEVMEALSKEPKEWESLRVGDCVFDPSKSSPENIEEYLNESKAPKEKQEYTILEDSSEDDSGNESYDLINQEECLLALHQLDYNIEKAIEFLSKRNQKWSDRRIDIEKWNDQEIQNFEQGMKTNYKEFRKIFQFLVSKFGRSRKTMRNIVHFYYIWKILPRHDEWKKQFFKKNKKKLSIEY